MQFTRCILILWIAAVLCGCVTKTSPRVAPSPAPVAAIRPTSVPTHDPKQLLTLDQIEPQPERRSRASTSAPTTTAATPLEALELYARARDALAERPRPQVFTAQNLLEKAIRLDPEQAELYRLLARAYQASGNTAKAIDALDRAVAVDPDDTQARATLGRLYLTRNNAPAAMQELRLATQTPDYESDDGIAASVDYFLARALQQQGYDRAALDQYRSLVARLSRGDRTIRIDPELNDLAARPAAVLSDIARLEERLGDYDAALVAWQEVADRDPDDFDARTHVIDVLLSLGRNQDALRQAAEVVRRSGASGRSLELLRSTCRRTGDEQAALDELRRLHSERPNDRAITYALVDLLSGSGREPEAEALLLATVRIDWDHETLRKLFDFYSDRYRAPEAATLLIEASAAHPEETGELARMYVTLLRPQRRDWLRASNIEGLQVPPSAQAAKYYFVSLAARGQREALSKQSLERAMQFEPPFAPAFRDAMIRIWSQPESNPGQKQAESDAMLASVRARGADALAEELAAYALISQGKTDLAMAALDRAIKASGQRGSDVEMIYADLQLATGNGTKYEQALWKVISDHPTWQSPYIRLWNYYTSGARGSIPPAALNVMQRWRLADPSSTTARLAEADLFSGSSQTAEATRVVTDLLREHPDDPEVVAGVVRIYAAQSKLPQLIPFLEDQVKRSPQSIAVVEQLVEFYHVNERADDAMRLLDATRAACASEPRLLYYIAQLYARIDRQEASQETLLKVLALTPDDAGTNNDLGYTWADRNMNLDRAETMVRLAVAAEPDNSSFLDSLGWVLYKRGRYDEARATLEQAAHSGDGAVAADPVVLDHLGDVLYRLKDTDAARARWTKSLELLTARPTQRDDRAELRGKLEQKLLQMRQGQPVGVAPVLEEPRVEPSTPRAAK